MDTPETDQPANSSWAKWPNILVAGLCLVVLVLLFWPMVGWQREQARRTQCQDNLQQLVLSCHNFESAFKRLPIGIQYDISRGQSHSSRAGNWAWLTFLVPYWGPGGLYSMLDPRSDNAFSDRITAANVEALRQAEQEELKRTPSRGYDDLRYYHSPFAIHLEELNEVMHVDEPVLRCPSDESVGMRGELRTGLTDSDENPVRLPRSNELIEFATVSYIAANSSRQCYALVAGHPNGETIATPPDGAFDGLKSRKPKDFLDGQANTVLLSERIAGSLNPWRERRRFGRPIPAGGATHIGCRGIGRSDIDGSKTNDPADAWGAPDVLFSAWGGINCRDEVRPWRKFQGVSSRHPGGVNIALADGSTRFIAETTTLSASEPNSLTPWTSAVAPADTWRSLIALADATTGEELSR